MKPPVQLRSLLIVALLQFALLAGAHSPANDMAEAAKNLLAALTDEQKAKASFAFTNAERVNFHFVPMPRKGLPIGEMTAAQRHLTSALISSALSHRGYFKVTTIMSLEQILFDLENQAARRNAELYYISIFGTPGMYVWGVRIEGHHLTLNFTARGDEILSSTPSFLGSNPAEVREGPRKGLRALAQEEELGRKLVKSLNEKQRATAIFSADAPRDIITGDARKARRLEPFGLAAADMSPEQRDLLVAIIREYIGRTRDEVAEAYWKQQEKDFPARTFFAWAGGIEPGQGHYYRVQGASFLLEYDNTQNNANHIHAVWRDLNNDFGDDLLKQHYQKTPHGQ